MKPVSKWFYLGSIFGSVAASAALSLAYVVPAVSGAAPADSGAAAAYVLFNCGAFVLQLYGFIVLLVLLFKMWSAIQDSRPRTTPGMAIALLFVPLFNFYWMFQVYWGWARDYNAYTRRKALRAPHMPEGVALAICIGSLVVNFALVAWFAAIIASAMNSGAASSVTSGQSIIVAALALIVLAVGAGNFVLSFYFFHRACDGINALVYRSARGAFGESTWSEACNICGARLRGAEQSRGLCTYCQRRAG
jgi:hypothetical protein